MSKGINIDFDYLYLISLGVDRRKKNVIKRSAISTGKLCRF